MNMLQVKEGKIVDSEGREVRLRGTGVGGWMNMENFINGYPGVEHTLRNTMARELDPEVAEFFFDRLLDYFLDEEDIKFIKQCGANLIRLPLNYRHFETDTEPFHYLEKGFERLERVIKWCEEQGIYAVLDLHAVQGWQNTDWHCDNPTRHGLFWQHPYFQDRFVALWEEFARRFKGNAAVAGYNVMNEPVTTAGESRFSRPEQPRWELLNRIYRRVVGAIRAIDPAHIIILEGDIFSNFFNGLEAPFADNLVYSSHNYMPPCFGPGPYPGEFAGKKWDRETLKETFENQEGTQFTHTHNVPLLVGEFGCVFNGPPEEIPDRLSALQDQIEIFEETGAHWSTWTYKDVGIMGWVRSAPESRYMEVIQPILRAKRLTSVDFWTSWMPRTKTQEAIRYLARYVETAIGDKAINPGENEHYMSQAALDGYVGALMQPAFAKCFLYKSMEEVDDILKSFRLENCEVNQDFIGVLKKYFTSSG